jgi:MFS transporter, MCT family, solute carrier family 16 (monocarboxylic acid transporters), member 10
LPFPPKLTQPPAVYLPLIYLPTYTSSLSLPSSKGALVLALANLAQILGELIFGKLSDLISVHILVILTSTTASLSTFLLWGFAATVSTGLPLTILYALVFCIAGAGFAALWARMGSLFGERDAMMVFSTMCAGRGVGAIVSGPLSEALLGPTDEVFRHARDGGFGAGRWVGVVVFVGGAMAASALLGLVGFWVDAVDGGGDVASWRRRTSASEKTGRKSTCTASKEQVDTASVRDAKCG